MKNENQEIDILEKNAWQMVLLAIVVILFLTLFLLSVQIYHQADQIGDFSLTEGPYVYYIFLAILVLLFCAYMIAQYRRNFQLSKAYSTQHKKMLKLSYDVKIYESLLEVSSIINSRQNLSEVLNAIVNEILACFDADHASIMILSKDSKSIETKLSVGKSSDIVKDAVVPIGESVSGFVLKSGKPLLLNGKMGPGDFPGAAPKTSNISSSMCIPLKTGDNIIGVLNLDLVDRDRVFTEDDLKLITIFANNAAVAINDAKLYKQITSFNTHLQQKIRERTKELEAANRVKSNFLSSVSHELRTPMNAIVGFSNILLDQNFGPLNEKQKKYTQNIADSGRRLNAIIDEILDISKLQASDFELHFSPFKIKKLIEAAVVVFNEAASRKKINYAIHVPDGLIEMTINADENKLNQIIRILISNAFKFTPENGSVMLSAKQVSSTKSEGERSKKLAPRNFLAFSVSDNGIGIPLDEQKSVFKNFYQIKGGLQGKTSGIGLGLSLAKRLVELHRGRIFVQSEGVDKGSRFIFYIPLTGS